MTTLDKSILTPIVANEADLAKRIERAINENIKNISVYGEYTIHFFEVFLKRIEEGYTPLVDSATNYGGNIRINMRKPEALLEEEHKKLTLEATKEYEEHIKHKEEKRKQALKREQARIKAEREKRELEDEFLDSVINAKI
ncbi:hypothetical protein Q4503_13280 [Colwellia sp. 6_MG-2023]|uniref:hypothetical protein n=1 Tax=Colwellia sp. 6_MG-2023 TaxID=3062676 RepID=UPI0026E3F68D|nr:hypothetical protein [Colwellia sp. 6_MG-2023]MDO6488673.1 hypothetical protein [Colwellia sp. 6_MG-2023]